MDLIHRLLTAQEAAKHLNISYRYILELSRKGLIPHVTLGGTDERRGRVFFLSQHLNAWLENQSNQSICIAEDAYGKLRVVKA